METKDVNSKPMDADKKKKASKRKCKDEFEICKDGHAEACEPPFKHKTYSDNDKLEKPIRVKQYSSFLDDKMKESK